MTFIEAQSIWFGCAVLLLVYTTFQLAMNASYRAVLNPSAFERSNYMKMLSSYALRIR